MNVNEPYKELKDYLEQSCRENDSWHASKINKFEYRHILKYKKEIILGSKQANWNIIKKGLVTDRQLLSDQHITPFYPLLTFPDQLSKDFEQL